MSTGGRGMDVATANKGFSVGSTVVVSLQFLKVWKGVIAD